MSIRTSLILSCFFMFSFAQRGNTQSPYEVNWKEESYHFAVGGLTLGTGIVFASHVKGLNAEDVAAHYRLNINRFDRYATYQSSYAAKKASDVLLLTSFSLPLSLLSSKRTREDFAKISILFGETVFITAGITYFTKGVVLRSRPLVYNEDFGLADKQKVNARHAFFSGHTSLTAASCFFTAKVYADYFPDSKFKPYVWAGAIIVPAVTGYLRIAAGKHFPTDVIMGYAVGATIGFLVPHFHKNVKIGNTDTSVSLSVGVTGASLKWALN